MRLGALSKLLILFQQLLCLIIQLFKLLSLLIPKCTSYKIIFYHQHIFFFFCLSVFLPFLSVFSGIQTRTQLYPCFLSTRRSAQTAISSPPHSSSWSEICCSKNIHPLYPNNRIKKKKKERTPDQRFSCPSSPFLGFLRTERLRLLSSFAGDVEFV